MRTSLLIVFTALLFTSCSEYQKILKSDDAAKKYAVADSLYEAGKYKKSLKLMEQREWVSTWRKPDAIFGGIKNLVITNRVSILYAVMAGLSIAGVALIWKGYAYVMVIMSVYLLIQYTLSHYSDTSL